MESLEDTLKRVERDFGSNEPTTCRCGEKLEHGTICERCAAAERNKSRVSKALWAAGSEYRELRFGGEGELRNADRRVHNKEALSKGRSLVTLPRVILFGETGVGKTSLMVAMAADRMLRTGEYGRWVPCRELAICRAQFETSDPSLESKALAVDLLILDDLGNGHEVRSSPIKDIIDKRHKNGGATWITTYLGITRVGPQATQREVEEAVYAGLAEVLGGDIARRLCERAAIIDCNPKKAVG